jgi:trigger factor
MENVKEFKNEDFTVKVTLKKDCIVELHIFASKEFVKKLQKKAIKEVSKDIDLPGFRKGKAPEDFILKKYPQNIEQELKNQITNTSFIEAQKLVKIFPLNKSTKITFDLKKHSLEEGSEVFFSYETEPPTPTIDKTKFKLKEIKKREVTEKNVNEAIRQAQFFFASWKEVTRPIKEGDFVILDLEAIDKEPPTKVFSDTRFEVKDKSIAKWMKALLIGAKKNDVLEGISKPDEDLPEREKKAFEPKKVRVTIKKIEEADLPELTDEFAKKTGAENLEIMRKSIFEMLNKKSEREFLNKKREQVNKFLLENYKFDLPLSLVNSEKEYRKNQMLKNEDFKKHFDKMSDMEKKAFDLDMEKQSKEAISLFYLSHKIIEDAKITITKDEIHKEAINMILDQTPLTKEPDIKNIKEETKAAALSRLHLQKAQDFILKT